MSDTLSSQIDSVFGCTIAIADFEGGFVEQRNTLPHFAELHFLQKKLWALDNALNLSLRLPRQEAAGLPLPLLTDAYTCFQHQNVSERVFPHHRLTVGI